MIYYVMTRAVTGGCVTYWEGGGGGTNGKDPKNLPTMSTSFLVQKDSVTLAWFTSVRVSELMTIDDKNTFC